MIAVMVEEVGSGRVREHFAGDPTSARAVLVIFGLVGLVGVVTMSMRHTASWIIGGTMVVVAVWGSRRAVASGHLTVTAAEVTIPSFFGSRHYPRAELAGARVGRAGTTREHLVLVRTDGREVAIWDFNCRRAGPDQPETVVERAVSAITGAGGREPHVTTLVLEEWRDENGLHARWLDLHLDGRLAIRGQDLGRGVETMFGGYEYEFTRTVDVDGVRGLRRALGLSDADFLLPAIAARFTTSHALEHFLEVHAITTELWNRVGD